ncbi:MAG: hypothetical protein J2P18_23520 [Nocardia sp.]|nr:hypothetical protein [Nocardia sp.]
MRTAVIRVDVDPAGKLSRDVFAAKISDLTVRAVQSGMSVSAPDVETLPPRRREIQLLIEGEDDAKMSARALELCTEVFGADVRPGPVTFVSRGTDADARGVLAGFGLTGEIDRTVDAAGYDILTVRLARADLERVPESRIQTALEAATNSEVVIVAS